MGHYASEMGYASPLERHRQELIAQGKCVSCEGHGFIKVNDLTGFARRALCFDCRGKGNV